MLTCRSHCINEGIESSTGCRTAFDYSRAQLENANPPPRGRSLWRNRRNNRHAIKISIIFGLWARLGPLSHAYTLWYVFTGECGAYERYRDHHDAPPPRQGSRLAHPQPSHTRGYGAPKTRKTLLCMQHCVNEAHVAGLGYSERPLVDWSWQISPVAQCFVSLK